MLTLPVCFLGAGLVLAMGQTVLVGEAGGVEMRPSCWEHEGAPRRTSSRVQLARRAADNIWRFVKIAAGP